MNSENLHFVTAVAAFSLNCDSIESDTIEIKKESTKQHLRTEHRTWCAWRRVAQLRRELLITSFRALQTRWLHGAAARSPWRVWLVRRSLTPMPQARKMPSTPEGFGLADLAS